METYSLESYKPYTDAMAKINELEKQIKAITKGENLDQLQAQAWQAGKEIPPLDQYNRHIPEIVEEHEAAQKAASELQAKADARARELEKLPELEEALKIARFELDAAAVEARELITKHYRPQHEQAAARVVVAMRELTDAMEEERTISRRLNDQSDNLSGILPIADYFRACVFMGYFRPFGKEDQPGTVLNILVTELEKRGYQLPHDNEKQPLTGCK